MCKTNHTGSHTHDLPFWDLGIFTDVGWFSTIIKGWNGLLTRVWPWAWSSWSPESGWVGSLVCMWSAPCCDTFCCLLLLRDGMIRLIRTKQKFIMIKMVKKQKKLCAVDLQDEGNNGTAIYPPPLEITSAGTEARCDSLDRSCQKQTFKSPLALIDSRNFALFLLQLRRSLSRQKITNRPLSSFTGRSGTGWRQKETNCMWVLL